MKEVIILEVNGSKKSHLIQDFLKQKKIDYRILAETKLELNYNLAKQGGRKAQKIDIFAKYGEAIRNQAREKELMLWDNADLDEKLNTDGEWWN